MDVEKERRKIERWRRTDNIGWAITEFMKNHPLVLRLIGCSIGIVLGIITSLLIIGAHLK